MLSFALSELKQALELLLYLHLLLKFCYLLSAFYISFQISEKAKVKDPVPNFWLTIRGSAAAT